MPPASAPGLTEKPVPGSRGKFVYLFVAQVLMLVSSPFLDRPGWPTVLFRFIGAATFVSAIYAVSNSRRHGSVALMLALPAGVLNAMVAFGHQDEKLIVATLLFTIAFLAFTLVLLIRAVITASRVTADTIYGAISAYLLIALTWGTLYLLLVTLQPGALLAKRPGQTLDWGDCVFYSYVTLTSLGYGDIIPTTPHARSLSILEAVTGIMYVAVLIARLVGMYSSERSHGRAS